MTIVRRELILLHKQPQPDGRQMVTETCWDEKGRKYKHGPYKTDDIARSMEEMTARDWSKHYERAEAREKAEKPSLWQKITGRNGR